VRSDDDAFCIFMAVVIILCAMFVAFVPRAAKAHSWYDVECCHNDDCKPVAYEDVEEVGGGSWRHVPSGTVFTRAMVKPSKDRHFHVCIGNKSWNKGKPLCIYTLQGI
jgi:hypothetical protein